MSDSDFLDATANVGQPPSAVALMSRRSESVDCQPAARSTQAPNTWRARTSNTGALLVASRGTKMFAMAKHPLRYWFWRIYVPAVWLSMATVILHWMFTLDLSMMPFLLFGMPFYALAIIAILNLFAFPFDYSIMGKYRRTPLPSELPLRTHMDLFWPGFAGRANLGFVVWLLYRHGIGIKTVYGNAFIPLDEIDGLDLEQGFDQAFQRNRTSTLYHHCPEVREPIYMPRWIARIVAAYYPAKVIVDAQLA
jgi:hypothetical protein